MRTVSASKHVLRLAAELCQQRDLPPLTADQAVAVSDAVDRLYGIPLDAPTPEELAEIKAAWERR